MNDNFKVITQDYSSFLSVMKEEVKKFKTVEKTFIFWITTVLLSLLMWILLFVGVSKDWGSNTWVAFLIIALILDALAFGAYIRVKINKERSQKFLNSFDATNEQRVSELVESLNLINTSVGINDLAMFQKIRQETTQLSDSVGELELYARGFPLFFRKKHKESIINYIESIESTVSSINELEYRQWEKNKQ
ncbi:hypothetical protein [Mycoplasma sp. 1654_15]|uniref:hypothetical protein n=1 Tax=Mycoplasma sp. 1654_15 TaxID=2725994 RepID=UPI001448FFBA|nr:hypothetical protein [Mycoplasma sp. 1654_15]QJB70923.1 hypothetical protein HF996_00045 [Mycoplasma sp. 1654_15]